MEPATLLIAAIGSLAAFSARPILGLIVYVAVLAWYPSYITFKVGTLDFSASRIVILALYVNILFRTKLAQQFKWAWLDRLVIIALLGTVIAGLMNEPFWKIIENRSGAAFNTLLPYFAVRMIVTSRAKFLTLLKGFLVVGAPLAIMGAYQSLTGHNPVGSAYSAKLRVSSGYPSVIIYPPGNETLYVAVTTFTFGLDITGKTPLQPARPRGAGGVLGFRDVS